MNQHQKRVKIIVFKQLDLIFDSCKTIAKEWNDTNISLNYLETTIKLARPKDLDTTSELTKFMEAYDTTMNTMLTLCQNKATAMDRKSVPLKYLKGCLDKVKVSFKKGLSS